MTNATFVNIQPLLRKVDVSFDTLLGQEFFKAFMERVADKVGISPQALYTRNYTTDEVLVHRLVYAGILLHTDPAVCYRAAVCLLDGATGAYDSLRAIGDAENDIFESRVE